MSRINKALLRKAKAQVRESAKSGDEQANDILKRRSARKAVRREAASSTTPSVRSTTWNFSAGDLVTFKPKYAHLHDGDRDDGVLLVVDTVDWNGYRQESKAGGLMVLSPSRGIISISAAAVRKV